MVSSPQASPFSSILAYLSKLTSKHDKLSYRRVTAKVRHFLYGRRRFVPARDKWQIKSYNGFVSVALHIPVNAFITVEVEED
jgi:hypothetical protein